MLKSQNVEILKLFDFETALRKIIFFLFYTKQFQNVTLSPTF